MSFVYNKEKHSYHLDGKEMTGMTTILGVLAKPSLIPWAAKMACEYVWNNKENITTAFSDGAFTYDCLDEEKLGNVLEEAKKAHTKKKEDAAQKGTDTHALVEEYIKECINNWGGRPAVSLEQKYETIASFIVWAVKENIKFLASEGQVYSKDLFVAGTFDFMFEKDGKKYMGDIKTYKKIWDRVPFYQCAGYSYLHKEMTGEDVEGYCIFNLPKERKFNEAEDVMWSFDREGDTKAFLACVTLYRQNANFAKKSWKN